MLAGEISEENSRGVPFQWGREGDRPEPGEQGAVWLVAGGLDLERQGALCHPGGRRGGVGSLVQSCCQHVAGPSQYQSVGQSWSVCLLQKYGGREYVGGVGLQNQEFSFAPPYEGNNFTEIVRFLAASIN